MAEDSNKTRAEREARAFAHKKTQLEEGHWLGETTADENPAAAALIKRYNETLDEHRACPHLATKPDQARFWVEAVPELEACSVCTVVIVREEKKRANSCCLFCRRHVKLRGLSVAVHGIVMRGGICGECEKEHGVLEGTSL